MEIRDSEKLIVMMLCDIHEHLNIKDSIDPVLIRDAIRSGNTWGLEWEYSGIFGIEESPKEIVDEVGEILTMWYFIENGYSQLTPEQKERVAHEGGTLGRSARFPGFDGNNESRHLNVASFLIRDMKRFENLSGRDLNSHAPLLPHYKVMVKAFRPIRDAIGPGGLTVQDLIRILQPVA